MANTKTYQTELQSWEDVGHETPLKPASYNPVSHWKAQIADPEFKDQPHPADGDDVLDHAIEAAKKPAMERPPTADELLKAGEVRQELHNLPTPTYHLPVEQDAIEAERKVQAELQRLADKGARDRAQMPSWAADEARKVSMAQQNKFIKATATLMRTSAGSGGDEGRHFVKPDGAAYETPKPATGFTVAAKGRRRIAKAELPQRRTLMVISNAIRAAIEKDDKADAGRLLLEAKALIGHGDYLNWIERQNFGIAPRTAQRLAETAK
jgi:hypothetical protein